jgi:hypothetical protein
MVAAVALVALVLVFLNQQLARREAAIALAGAINQHIAVAKERSLEAVNKRADEVRVFVLQSKSGAKPFAKEVVSLRGKWQALRGSKKHKKFVIEQFDRHIFTPKQISDRVKAAVEHSVRDLDQEQNNLAVAIRMELLGRPLAPGEIQAATEELSRAVDRVVATAQDEAMQDAAALVATEVTGTIAAQVFTRVGVTAGVLSAGAATSWWTFGAGAAIGFVAGALWDWIDDPAKDVQREVERSLDDLSVKVADAVRDEMVKVVAARHAIWEKAAKEMD